jgi:hypothetical protein
MSVIAYRRIKVIVAIVIMMNAPFLSSALPHVDLVEPSDLSVLTNTTVNITGTSTGSDSWILQKGEPDFADGTMGDTQLDAGGNLTLRGGLYDDFNQEPQPGEPDPNRWSVAVFNGSIAVLGYYGLCLGGSTGSAYYWTCRGEVISKNLTGNYTSAELMWTGNLFQDYNTSVGLYQDEDNWITIGKCFDYSRFGSKEQTYGEMCSNGTYQNFVFGNAPSCPNKYSLRYEGNAASLYQDGTLLDRKNIFLKDIRCIFKSSLDWDEAVTVLWDNATFERSPFGNFTSAPLDTRSSDPVLKKVSWDSYLPSGTSLSVKVRSSDRPDMGSATDWVPVTNRQDTALPSARRYVQYMVSMATTDLENAPVFRSFNVSFSKPVSKIEVSLDSKQTWLLANGTASWHILASLPEGKTTIWVRATDVSGDTDINSRRIDVDLTPPEGSMVINGGEPATQSRDVILSFTAMDTYGIGRVRLSEDPSFSRAEWLDYLDTMNYTLSLEEGIKTVYAVLRDKNGWESLPFNASIIYDDQPPAGNLTIDDGSGYTRNTSVRLNITATDQSGIAEMMVSNAANLGGAVWAPFRPVLDWTIPASDGTHTVFLKLKDAVGHVTEPITAQVVKDSVSPAASLKLNDGAQFANSQKVLAKVTASDDNPITSMQLSESIVFAGASWMPYLAGVDWNLSAGDGAKKVYARVRDAAGNYDNVASADIVLDTKAPSSAVSSIPPVSATPSFAVKWSGDDGTSGVRWYDVQYQDGEEQWKDWVLQAKSTQANFNGGHGHTYGFRVRAVDLAGNIEAYPEAPDASVTVEIPELMRPVVVFGGPQANATLGGLALIVGSSAHPVAGRAVTGIEVQIDGGGWNPAKGTTSWSYKLDTAGIPNGRHFIRVRAFDGHNYSAVEELPVTVNNDQSSLLSGSTMLLLLGILIVAACAAMGAVRLRRRSNRRLYAAPGLPGPSRSAREVAPEAAPVPAQDAVYAGSAAVGSSYPAPEPLARPPSVEKQAAARRQNILNSLSSLPRGLPSVLSLMELDELADMIADGERKTSAEGDELVRVNHRWFLADENDPVRFMQEYQK